MILWSIQSEGAWQTLETSGVLRASQALAESLFAGAYRWMTEKMRERIGPPPSPDAWPVWAWSQWAGVRRQRPDLRSVGHLARGERGVRMELEAPASMVLLSDFELWHYVLNGWYLPASLADGERFDALLASKGFAHPGDVAEEEGEIHDRIRASWDRIFDLDWAEPDVASSRDEKSIQGTLWELSIEQVRVVRRFTAR